MSVSLFSVSLDCADAGKLADFWSQVLDRPVDDGATPDFATIGMQDGAGGLVWMLHRVPDSNTSRARVRFSPDVSQPGFPPGGAGRVVRPSSEWAKPTRATWRRRHSPGRKFWWLASSIPTATGRRGRLPRPRSARSATDQLGLDSSPARPSVLPTGRSAARGSRSARSAAELLSAPPALPASFLPSQVQIAAQAPPGAAWEHLASVLAILTSARDGGDRPARRR
jgi:hypothetical protein